MKAMAVKNKKSIYTLYPALCIKIKIFNPFKRNLVAYIRRITITNNVIIGKYYFLVLAHLIGFGFKDNKKRDNMAVYAYCFSSAKCSQAEIHWTSSLKSSIANYANWLPNSCS